MGREENIQSITTTFRTSMEQNWSGPSERTNTDVEPDTDDMPKSIADEIAESIEQAAKDIANRCFKLPNEIWRTILKSGAEPKDIILLRNIEYTPMFSSQPISPLSYELPTTLNWLRDLPFDVDNQDVKPAPDSRNWIDWWLRMNEKWHQRIDSPQPLYHQLIKPDEIDPAANRHIRTAHQIVYAVVAHACVNEPRPHQLSQELMARNPDHRIQLSTLQRTLYHVATMRKQTGLLPKPAPTPETILEDLAKRRIDCNPDCGQLQHPEKMFQTFGPDRIIAMTADPIAKVWYSDVHLTGHREAQHNPETRIDDKLPNQRPNYEPERSLILNLAPDDPIRQKGVFNALAVTYGISPTQAFAAAMGRNISKPTNPDICPAVEQCHSACALRQRQGITKFPATWTGDYHDCAYYEYLIETESAHPTDQPKIADEWQNHPRKPQTDQPNLTARRTRKNRQDTEQVALFK